jgi:hypothetical protein
MPMESKNGVINEPPPTPVRPTKKPTRRPNSTGVSSGIPG